MTKRYDYLLLDADNTLFDFDQAEHLALMGTLAKRNLPATEESEALYLSLNRPLWAAFDRGEVTQDFLTVERFRLLLERLGSTADPAAMNQDYLTRLGQCSQLLPGAEELCLSLQAAGYTLAIVTNGVTAVQTARFAACPITPCFSHIFISQEIGFRKPEPEFFDAVCAKLGITCRSKALVIGDSLFSDIQGAINSGMDSVWYSPGDKNSPLPTYVVRDHSHLKRLLT